jgi:NADH-quinone oxidoreductase subunit A
MPNAYLHLAIMAGIAVLFAVAFGLLSRLVGPRRPTPEKTTTYETGIAVPGTFLGRFNVKFCAVAILFLLFDLEIVFLYPGAVVLRDLGLQGIVEVLIFLGVLLVGWIFVVRSGVLDWGTPPAPWPRHRRRGQAGDRARRRPGPGRSRRARPCRT